MGSDEGRVARGESANRRRSPRLEESQKRVFQERERMLRKGLTRRTSTNALPPRGSAFREE